MTVIVPVHNGAADLARCLDALRAQDYPATSYDVVVVDNGSTENIGAVASTEPGVTLLTEHRPGSYAARNTGLASASGELLAFTDADCSPSRHWLSRAVAVLEGPPGADMVGGAVDLRFATGAPRTAAELYESIHAFPQQRYLEEQGWAVTANMVTWRRVFDQVGLFDANLRSRGDAQWGQRVAAAGLTQRFVPDAVVFHPARTTWRELLTKSRRVVRGRIDADLAAGRRGRHFMGLAANQASMLVAGARASVGRPELRSTGDLCRYITALAACRATGAALMLAASVRRPPVTTPSKSA